jgi:hypothetical protein
MAAGLGFKTFTTGEVLNASDVNGYLMQGVLVFASATARDAAITSPQEGQFAFTKDTNGLWYYDGATWVASGATGDIEGVTAGTGISGGGTSGTVTITNSMATAIDAKGDLVVGTGADTFSRLAVGATNGHVLTVDSAEATGLKYAAAGGAKSYTLLSTTSTSTGTSYTVSGLSGYDNLMIMFKNVNNTDTGNNQMYLRPNNNTTAANYNQYAWSMSPPSTMTNVYIGDAGIKVVNNGTVAGKSINGYIYLFGANTSGKKIVTQATSIANGTGGLGLIGGGDYTDANVISSVTLVTLGGAFSGGTMYIYGAV